MAFPAEQKKNEKVCVFFDYSYCPKKRKTSLFVRLLAVFFLHQFFHRVSYFLNAAPGSFV